MSELVFSIVSILPVRPNYNGVMSGFFTANMIPTESRELTRFQVESCGRRTRAPFA